jgi:hypothetical protein
MSSLLMFIAIALFTLCIGGLVGTSLADALMDRRSRGIAEQRAELDQLRQRLQAIPRLPRQRGFEAGTRAFAVVGGTAFDDDDE